MWFYKNRLLIILLLVVFVMVCCKEQPVKEEGFKLPSEESIALKLGENYSFTLEFHGTEISYKTKYIVTEAGYYVEYESDDEKEEDYAYLYLLSNEQLYYGSKYLLNKKSDSDLFDLGNGLDYLAFFADTAAEEETTGFVGGRECVKYVIKETSLYSFSCYIDKETGACLRCVARSSNDYYEWTVKDFVIGGQDLTEQIKKINVEK